MKHRHVYRYTRFSAFLCGSIYSESISILGDTLTAVSIVLLDWSYDAVYNQPWGRIQVSAAALHYLYRAIRLKPHFRGEKTGSPAAQYDATSCRMEVQIYNAKMSSTSKTTIDLHINGNKP